MSECLYGKAHANVSFSQESGAPRDRLLSPTQQNSRFHASSSTPTIDQRSRATITRGRLPTSTRTDSIRRTEGRRVSQDTRRYMQAASATSQAAVHQLIKRLQTYRTFQPFIAPPAPYRDDLVRSDRDRRGGSSLGAVDPSQLWQMVDGLLETSVAHLLQHNAEDHFVMTLQSASMPVDSNNMAKVRTIIESRKASLGVETAASNEAPEAEFSTSSLSRHMPGPSLWGASHHLPDLGRAFVDRWAADHPFASAAEVEARRQAWTALELRRQQASRAFYLSGMQAQLDALQAEEEEDGSGGPGMGSFSKTAKPGRNAYQRSSSSMNDWGDTFDAQIGRSQRHTTTMHVSAEEESRVASLEREKQQALWDTFHTEVTPPRVPKAPLGSALDAPRIVSAYMKSADLHDWLHASWAHRTHRHESAALRIQCAFRVHRARCEVRGRRYARRQIFLASLSAEREARRMWEVALQVQTETTGTANNADATMRALTFFIRKVNAVVAKRRARRQLEEKQLEDIRGYAATRIQAVYKGHRARVLVMEMRNPEIVERREHQRREQAAIVIQAYWRRYFARGQWRRSWQAVCALQGLYRSRLARRTLARRRYERAVAATKELEKFAVQRIERWYAAFLAVRTAFAEAHRMELVFLQRVCRGYLGRKRLQREALQVCTRAAVLLVEQLRCRELASRRAKHARATLDAGRRAAHEHLLRTDAAVTIQRGWRGSRSTRM